EFQGLWGMLFSNAGPCSMNFSFMVGFCLHGGDCGRPSSQLPHRWGGGTPLFTGKYSHGSYSYTLFQYLLIYANAPCIIPNRPQRVKTLHPVSEALDGICTH